VVSLKSGVAREMKLQVKREERKGARCAVLLRDVVIEGEVAAFSCGASNGIAGVSGFVS
jgi:hypothetical protein